MTRTAEFPSSNNRRWSGPLRQNRRNDDNYLPKIISVKFPNEFKSDEHYILECAKITRTIVSRSSPFGLTKPRTTHTTQLESLEESMEKCEVFTPVLDSCQNQERLSWLATCVVFQSSALV